MTNFRNFAVWIVIAMLLFALFSLFQGQVTRTNASEISYSDFMAKVKSGQVKSATFSNSVGLNSEITAQLSDGKVVRTVGPILEEQLKALEESRIETNFQPAQNDSFLTNALIYWLPTIAADRRVDLLHPPDAIGRRQGHGLWQVEGEASDRDAMAA